MFIFRLDFLRCNVEQQPDLEVETGLLGKAAVLAEKGKLAYAAQGKEPECARQQHR